MKLSQFLLLASLTTLLFGCTSGSHKDPYEGRTAESIYTTGKKAMARGDYPTAIKAFQGLESHYPFGDYTQQGQLEIIYANYLSENHTAAMLAADRFARLHPRFPYLDYVLYMKGLNKFNENISLMEKFMPIQPAKRDVSHEREAFLLFSEFLTRFPESQYAPDARQRLIYLRNTLAQHEYHTAEFYLQRGALIAAANRLQAVVKLYDEADIMPDSLALLEKIYLKLKMDELARDTHEVLAMNFPDFKPTRS